MKTDNFCFYLHNRVIQTSQAGGQRYSDTSPCSIPSLNKIELCCSLRCDQILKNHYCKCGHTLLCYLIKSDLSCTNWQTRLWCWFIDQNILSYKFRVTKFISIITINVVTLCCVPNFDLRCTNWKIQPQRLFCWTKKVLRLQLRFGQIQNNHFWKFGHTVVLIISDLSSTN